MWCGLSKVSFVLIAFLTRNGVCVRVWCACTHVARHVNDDRLEGVCAGC